MSTYCSKRDKLQLQGQEAFSQPGTWVLSDEKLTLLDGRGCM